MALSAECMGAIGNLEGVLMKERYLIQFVDAHLRYFSS